MKEPNDREIIAAMRKYGGGFINALAAAARVADESNLEKLKKAWPDEWTKYREFALLDREPKESEVKA